VESGELGVGSGEPVTVVGLLITFRCVLQICIYYRGKPQQTVQQVSGRRRSTDGRRFLSAELNDSLSIAQFVER